MANTLLFVYGTLKSSQPNNKMLAGQRFIANAATLPLYRMYSLGWHPGMVIAESNGDSIAGEIWEVDPKTLSIIDEYEGVPHWFIRDHVAIRDIVGDIQAYFYNESVPDDAPCGTDWPFPS